MPRHGSNASVVDAHSDRSHHGSVLFADNSRHSRSVQSQPFVRHGPPNPDHEWNSDERAESEVPTIDPLVEPDVHASRRRRNRRSRRARQAQHDHVDQQDGSPQPVSQLPLRAAEHEHDDDSDVARAIQQSLVNRDSSSSAHSWNSRMGPEKGIKFRSGAPPQPPGWKYCRQDLRSYAKWERKLQVWQLQVASYMTRREAALLLFASLSGEAEEELENCDLKQVNSSTGIEYIQEQLKAGLQTKLVYQKRKLLSDHETIVRQNGESIWAYTNRYRRTERALASVGVNVEACTTKKRGATDFWREPG